MKTLLFSLALFAIAPSILHAQTKQWTWTAPKDGTTRILSATAIGPDGSGAFVTGEFQETGCLFRLNWVSPKGKAYTPVEIGRADFKAVFPDGDASVNPLGESEWRIAFAGPMRVMVSEPRSYGTVKMALCSIAGGKVVKGVTINATAKDGDAILFSGASKTGWLEPTGAMVGYFSGGPYAVFYHVQNVEKLSFWTP